MKGQCRRSCSAAKPLLECSAAFSTCTTTVGTVLSSIMKALLEACGTAMSAGSRSRAKVAGLQGVQVRSMLWALTLLLVAGGDARVNSFVLAQRLTVVYEAQALPPAEILARAPHQASNATLYRSRLFINGWQTEYVTEAVYLSGPRLQGGTEVCFQERIYKDHQKSLWRRSSARFVSGKGQERVLTPALSASKYNWQPTGRDSVILGLNCKGVRSEYGVAWYSAEVPFPDGPQSGDFGLPGLVLLLQLYNMGIWQAVAVEFACPPLHQPDLVWSKKATSLERPYAEMMRSRNNEGVLVIDADTPVGQWIEFP